MIKQLLFGIFALIMVVVLFLIRGSVIRWDKGMGDKLSRKYELTIFPKKEGLEVIIRNGCKTKKKWTQI